MRRQTTGHPTRHVLDQRRVGHHQALARVNVTACLEAAPQLAQLDRFDVGLHPTHFRTSRARMAPCIGGLQAS
jgi:hypothetical protein